MSPPGGTHKEVRSSNLELFRVIVMLLIVAHHYVANSGLMDLIYESPTSINAIFLLLFGAWGKTGINCFALITGYFMCKSQITLKKYVKLLLEIYLYRVLIYLCFLLTGYESFSLKGLLKLIAPFTSIESNFTGCYLLFYLFIPFLNILLRNLTQRKHLLLIILCLVVYTVFGGLDGLSVFKLEMNYVSWFIVLYFIGAYIQMYPQKLFCNRKFWGSATAISVLFSIASVLVCAWLGQRLNHPKLAYFFVSDSNKILALTNGVCAFLFFNNLKLGHSKLINVLGGSTFGVLLIHAGSWTMIQWLWKDFLQNTTMFGSSFLIVHALLCTVGVYTVATIIDMLRIRFIEKPIFRFWDKHYANFSKWYHKKEKGILSKLQIEE